MTQHVLAVEVRSSSGKGISRKLRSGGKIPGVVYGRGMEAVPVAVDLKELLAVTAGHGMNNLISLQGEAPLGGSTVIIADIQRECMKGIPAHIDLHRVNMSEKVRVHVPVKVVGTARGVKEGGLLDVAFHSLDVECLPTQIPEALEVAIAELGIGHSIHIGEIPVAAGVKILGDPKAPVVSVLGKAREEAPAPEE